MSTQSHAPTADSETTFPQFQKLPPEIRYEIWNIALSQTWSFGTAVKLESRRKFWGVIHRKISHSCPEAHFVSRSRSTYLKSLGLWLDFSRHLYIFFYRENRYDFELLAHAQHVVVYPYSWEAMWQKTRLLQKRCKSLQTLVVVAPWFDPRDMPAGHDSESWAPWEDWRSGPWLEATDMNLELLIEDIEHRYLENEAMVAEYYARVDEAARQVPEDVPEGQHVFGRTRNALQRLRKIVQEFRYTKPRLYLRTREQLVKDEHESQP